jgi:multiple sugar transport system permease protein
LLTSLSQATNSLREGLEPLKQNRRAGSANFLLTDIPGVVTIKDGYKWSLTMTTTTEKTVQSRIEYSNKLKDRQAEAIYGWLMASPAMILLLTFLIIPFFLAFYFSFTNQRLISPNPTEYVGLTNFKQLLTIKILSLDPILNESGQPILDEEGNYTFPREREFTRNPDYPQYQGLQKWTSWDIGETRWSLLAGDVVFMKSLINTFYFALVIVPGQAGLGLLLALLINQRTKGVNIFRTLYFIPVVVSIVVVSILFEFIYDGENGLLNSLLVFITAGRFEPIDWMANTTTVMPAIMFMSAWQAVGIHMIIWLSGLQTIPHSLYEAADIDGANTWQKFRFVTWPGLRNVAVFVLVTITIAALGLFTQIDVMTQGGPLDSTTTVIYQAVRKGFHQQDIAYGSAISIVFFVLVLTVALVQRYITREKAA